MMIIAGMLFALSVLKNKTLPRIPVTLFLSGIIINLIIGIIPAPDIFQTVGSTLRNAGLITIGLHLIRSK